MATYVVTIPDGEELNADVAPTTRTVLIALAAGLYGEDVRSHCMAHGRPDVGTPDESTTHYRLGLCVRRIL